jgi:hypothetical protein
MQITLVKKLTLLLFLISLSIHAADPTNDERTKSAFNQALTAMMIKYELDRDKNCNKKYKDINLNDWADSFPADTKSKTTKSEIIEMMGTVLSKMNTTKAPNSDKTISQITYENIRESAVKSLSATGGDKNYCDFLYITVTGLVQKSKDNMKLIKN